MIPNTQLKLREAQFFHRELIKEHQKTVRSDPEAVGFYFSAFIAAARAVPWSLGNEQSKKYKAWEPAWIATLSPDDKQLLKFTNELRLDTTHRDGIRLTEKEERITFVEDQLGREVFLPYQMRWSALPGVGSASATRWIKIVARDGKIEVVELANKYMEYLQVFVREFLKAHELLPV